MNRRALLKTIIYEDDHFIAMNKPTGLLSIPDRSGNPNNAFEYLQKITGSLLIVHRIDKDTSGVLLFAKNETAHRRMSEMFEHRTLDKRYLVLVDGMLPEKKGRIDLPINKDKSSSFKMKISKNGKPSITEYEVIEPLGICSLVEARILTGRTHQIRVHFKAIGHPLFIDPLYSERSEFFLSQLKNKKYRLKKDTIEWPLIHRLTLHASQLSFVHPVSNQNILITAPLPKDMSALIHQLRKKSN